VTSEHFFAFYISMPPRFIPPVECPICGAAVPRNARACPGCGADERTGWDEEASRYDGVDLPDHVLDEREAKEVRVKRDQLTRTGVPYFTWIIAVIMLAVIGTLAIYRLL
jgi:glutaredoxin